MDIALTLRCMNIVVGISNYVFLVEHVNIVGDIRYRSVIVDSIAVASYSETANVRYTEVT